MALINSLCSMLRTTPFHRENYSRLILTVIGKFYQRCSDRFSHLVSVESGPTTADDDTNIALAAQWAQKAELGPCLTELFKLLSGNPSMAAKSQLCRQETHLENSLLGEGAVGKSDLVTSVRNVSALASLYHSVVGPTQCLLDQCTEMRCRHGLLRSLTRSKCPKKSKYCQHLRSTLNRLAQSLRPHPTCP